MSEQEARSERQVDLAGAASGYGSYCPEGIPVETAIFGLLGAFGVAFGVLYRAVTLKTARRRRRFAVIEDEPVSRQTVIYDMAWAGKLTQILLTPDKFLIQLLAKSLQCH